MPKTIILNGGNPIDDCPKFWDDANAWIKKVNEHADGCGFIPKWSFDCGFKLDFDGPILSITSRFYPPKTGYGPKWDGDATVVLMGENLKTFKFKCDTLEELKEKVEALVKKIGNEIEVNL